MDPMGVPWSRLGSFGGPLSDFSGSLDVLLVAVGCLGSPLGVLGDSWDVSGRLGKDFLDFPGNSGRPFDFMWFIFAVVSLF